MRRVYSTLFGYQIQKNSHIFFSKKRLDEDGFRPDKLEKMSSSIQGVLPTIEYFFPEFAPLASASFNKK